MSAIYEKSLYKFLWATVYLVLWCRQKQRQQCCQKHIMCLFLLLLYTSMMQCSVGDVAGWRCAVGHPWVGPLRAQGNEGGQHGDRVPGGRAAAHGGRRAREAVPGGRQGLLPLHRAGRLCNRRHHARRHRPIHGALAFAAYVTSLLPLTTYCTL